MWFQILGPVRGYRDGVELELGPPQQRTVLAVLLAAVGEPVGFAAIADVLWPDVPPPAAAATVQQYVSRLRRIIEPGRAPREQAGLLRRASGGYQVVAAESSLDLLRWRRLVAKSRAATSRAATDDETTAIATYAEAIALWSGPAASNLPPEVREHPVFAGLDREYVTVLSEAADLALGAGRGDRVVAALDRATGWYPFDEGLHARLLAALAAAGRRAEALRRFLKIRQRLVDELGIEPGPQLREAHRALLAVPDPEPPAATPAREPHVVRPAQLPADLRSFSGRDAELDRVDALAARTRPLVVITGLGGVGKTTLALRWAHRAAAEHPDGQLYADLRGFAPGNAPTDPAAVLHGFLEALGVPRTNQPATLEGLAALFRGVLSGRRVLVVLDNAHDDEQVRHLLPGSPGCTVIVTSRSYLGGLAVEHGASSMGLGVFNDEDAHRYLHSRLGRARVDTEPEATAEIIAVCGGLPLALAICAAWAERSPAFTLSALSAEIRRRQGLDAFAGVARGRDVRAVFSWSYRKLGAAAAALFRRLGGYPGADLAVAAAITISGAAPAEALTAINELVDAHLLAEVRPGRYDMHDLVRAYAAELCDESDRRQTLRCSVDYFLHSLIAGAKLVHPRRASVDPGPATAGVTPWRPVSEADALAWFADEFENVRAALDAAERNGLDPAVWLFSWGVNAYLIERLCRWDEAISIARRALVVAERHNAHWWRGYLHTALGICFSALDEFDEAYRQWEMTAAVGSEAGDPVRTAGGLIGMATIMVSRQTWPAGAEIERAADLADEAMALLATPDPAPSPPSPSSSVLRARLLAGHYHEFSAMRVLNRTGDVAAASAELDRGIRIMYDLNSPQQARSMMVLAARMYGHLGDCAMAVELYERTWELALRPDEEWTLDDLRILVELADCHAKRGEHDAAAKVRARARPYLDGVYTAFADQLRARLSGPDAPGSG